MVHKSDNDNDSRSVGKIAADRHESMSIAHSTCSSTLEQRGR